MTAQPYTVIDAEQRSPEWFAARLGRATASRASDFLAVNKDGKPAASRKNYLVQLVLERLTGKGQENVYQSRAMEVGVEREEPATFAFEAITGDHVRSCGFLSHDTLLAGASLDGYIGELTDPAHLTLLSIKCRQPAAHWEFLRYGRIPDSALHQIRQELWITGAAKHVYFSWNPDFEENKQAHSKTIRPEDVDLPLFDHDIRKFLADVDVEMNHMRGWQAVTA